jgi:Uncharacterised nucleotidyltransferase
MAGPIRVTSGLTQEQEWLLKASILRGSEAVESWERWKGAVNLDTIDRGSTRLLPLLWHNLLTHQVRDPLMPRLKEIHVQTWVRVQVLLRELAEVQAALDRAAIGSLVLKGAALAKAYYANPGLRPMDDIDLLVRPTHVSDAVAVLRREGWRSSLREPEQMLLVMNSTAFRDIHGHALDLHSHVLPGGLRTDLDERRWDRSVPAGDAPGAVRILDATDQLLHVLIHGAQSDPPAIHWMADAMLILRHPQASIDWKRLTHDAEEEGRGLALAGTLAQLQQLFAAPVPDEAMSRLASVPRPLLERVEHWTFVGAPAPVVGRSLKRYFDHRRWKRAPISGRQLGFAEYLQRIWEVERGRRFLGQVARRGWRRLRRDTPRIWHWLGAPRER